jgi:hypothetical protein
MQFAFTICGWPGIGLDLLTVPRRRVPIMEFRWIIFLVLWTILTGPVLAQPIAQTPHSATSNTAPALPQR